MTTLERIQARMKKLQAQAETLIAKRAQSVLDRIRALMEEHGLTTADIDAHSRRGARAGKTATAAPKGRRKAVKAMAGKGKLPAKYRNPETGQTWSGWARPPAWIANVKDRSKFLIDADSVTDAGAVQQAATAEKKTVAKKAAPPRKSASVQAAAKVPASKAGAKAGAVGGAKPAARTVASKKQPRTAGAASAKSAAKKATAEAARKPPRKSAAGAGVNDGRAQAVPPAPDANTTTIPATQPLPPASTSPAA
jgi:DNA-binding protein H-NS